MSARSRTRRGPVAGGAAWPAAVVALLLAGSSAGCSLVSRGDDAQAEEAEQALLDQRDRVGEELRDLLEGTEASLGQEVRTSTGRWEGCDSAFMDEFRTFRYTADVRLDVGPGAPERIAPALVDVARAAGWEVAPGPRERPSATVPDRAETVRAEKDGLTAALSDLAPAVEGDLLVEVGAEACVEVLEGERDAWLRRDDAGPLAD